MTTFTQARDSIHGSYAPEFARVVDAFAASIATNQDRGGQIAVLWHGEPVVNIYGGWNPPAGANTGGGVADGAVVEDPITERIPYPDNAVQLIFSQTKGLTGICFADCVARGLIDPDARVADYWPEFAANGKEDIRVSQLASHSAGLPGFDHILPASALFDWDLITSELAAQAPRWEPGTKHGYHALSMGYLAGELVRRVSGLTPKHYLEENFRAPLNLSVWIGCPESERSRIAKHFWGPRTQGWGGALRQAQADPKSTTSYAYQSPKDTDSAITDPHFLDAEMPSINGHADALSLATLYAMFCDGRYARYDAELITAVSATRAEGFDEVLCDSTSRYGLVFQLGSQREPMLSRGSFGHNGRGGCLSFADPGTGISFSYVENQLSSEPLPQARVCRLLAAVRDSLELA
ncbi:serine hydrolase domain-containing protein [Actinotignum sp. GS-2025g]|uniref:serine hydrolase domain-containing protein n=1 Tax=unclassified Actinotignum TaxID=2632702 RepID=UPI002A835456|nr:serine hydrolase domain-containing protein [Actinotignum sp. SLA_B059]MDY5127100.1 serine hydrolase domain-containing protein [Actinotignum sp. SLA_B059]